MNPAHLIETYDRDDAITLGHWSSTRALELLADSPLYNRARKLHRRTWRPRTRLARRRRLGAINSFLTHCERTHVPDSSEANIARAFAIALMAGRGSRYGPNPYTAASMTVAAHQDLGDDTHTLWVQLGRIHGIADRHLDTFADLAPDWNGTPDELATIIPAVETR